MSHPPNRQGGFLIARIHYLSGRLLAQKLREKNIEINPAQGRIMYVLWQQDAIPIKKLAEATSLKKNTLSSMLKRLEKMGYITQTPDQNDRRVTRISRSEKDRSWGTAYQEVSQEMVEIFYKEFKVEEIDRFEEYLQRILSNLS